MRVAFAGTPEFARIALAAILEAGFEVPLVLTQPDRPAGRGMKLQASAVKLLALDQGLTVAQPRSLRLDGKFPDEAAAGRQALEAAAPDVLVVAAYGLILPPWVLTTAAARLPEHPWLAAAALARRGADPARHRGWRQRNGHHHHADGRRPRHRRDAAAPSAGDHRRRHHRQPARPPGRAGRRS